LKKYKLPGSDQILAELMQAVGGTLVSVDQLFIDFKEAYDSFRKEVLYSILIELRVPMKLVFK
jgi:hypothetical protein